jgi:hypothetical protein
MPTSTAVASSQECCGGELKCQIDGEVLTDPTGVFIVNGEAMCEKHYDALMMRQIEKNGGEFY